MTILLVLSYDGSCYHGYQSQAQVTTVQEVVEQALASLYGKKKIATTAAGRTDAGVHALYQVISFQVKGRKASIPPEKVYAALNQKLPPSIRALSSRRVRGSFHPRYYARFKTYQYIFYTGAAPLPFLEKKAWYAGTEPLHTEKMKKAASFLPGRHDFSSFATKGSSQKSGICHVYEASLTSFPFQSFCFYHFTITADRFLFHMVRNILGALREIGAGQALPEKMKALLENPDINCKKYTVPPCGLYLTYVHYEEEDIKAGYRRPAKS